MNKPYELKTTCRVCSSNDLTTALALRPTPMGDKYVPYERRHEFADTLPLDIMMCRSCGHLQTGVIANPEILFRHYLSRPAAINPALSGAFLEYAEDLLKRFAPGGKGFAVELGSNDGLFIKFLQDKGMRVLGVDPALNLAKQAKESGVETLPEFFSADLADKIRKNNGQANLIIANHTFANINNIADVAKGIRTLLAPDGVFVMQTFYMRDVLEKKLLENFNHEHLSYFYVRSLDQYCLHQGLKLFEVQYVPAKGGSIRCFMQHAADPHPVSPSVGEMIRAEEALGMHKAETYTSITDFIQKIRNQLHDLFQKHEKGAIKVAAYGTSIGATTFTYQYDLGNIIQFYVDDDPYRQNLVSPGYHIPVLHPDELLKQRPDYVVILAPLYAENIIKKNQEYLRNGGKFVIIWPEFAVRSK